MFIREIINELTGPPSAPQGPTGGSGLSPEQLEAMIEAIVERVLERLAEGWEA